MIEIIIEKNVELFDFILSCCKGLKFSRKLFQCSSRDVLEAFFKITFQFTFPLVKLAYSSFPFLAILVS